jgi:hypothetical protein
METLHKHSIVSLETVALWCSLIDSIKAKTRFLALQRDRLSVCPSAVTSEQTNNSPSPQYESVRQPPVTSTHKIGRNVDSPREIQQYRQGKELKTAQFPFL